MLFIFLREPRNPQWMPALNVFIFLREPRNPQGLPTYRIATGNSNSRRAVQNQRAQFKCKNNIITPSISVRIQFFSCMSSQVIQNP